MVGLNLLFLHMAAFLASVENSSFSDFGASGNNFTGLFFWTYNSFLKPLLTIVIFITTRLKFAGILFEDLV